MKTFMLPDEFASFLMAGRVSLAVGVLSLLEALLSISGTPRVIAIVWSLAALFFYLTALVDIYDYFQESRVVPIGTGR
jgi:hypothetical protein